MLRVCCFLFPFTQVIVAIISFLETMLLMYLSYKVTHRETHTHSLQACLQNTVFTSVRVTVHK